MVFCRHPNKCLNTTHVNPDYPNLHTDMTLPDSNYRSPTQTPPKPRLVRMNASTTADLRNGYQEYLEYKNNNNNKNN